MTIKRPKFKKLRKLKRPTDEQKVVYNKLVRALNFKHIRAEAMSSKSGFELPPAEKRTAEYGHIFQYSIIDGELWIRATFWINVDHPEGKTSTFTGKITFLLQYGQQGEKQIDLTKVDASVLEAYVAVHAPAHYWPYAREAFSSMSSRTGLPPLTLPVFVPHSLRQS